MNEIHYHPKDADGAAEFIELHNPDAAEVKLGGWKLEEGVKFRFPDETVIPPGGYVVVADNPEAFQKAYGKQVLGPWKKHLSNRGEKIVLATGEGKVADEVTFATGFPWPTAADGEGPSMELIHPALDRRAGSSWRSSTGRPTPGARNSTASTEPPPSISAIGHAPQQPRAGEAVRAAARVVAPCGVKAVSFLYQVVEPGHYVRKEDAAYEKNWAALPMHDDGKDGDRTAGDGVFSVTLPASLSVHRRLIRYRIAAEDQQGQQVRVPYADDGSPNFAFFCYNGAPEWVGTNEPGKTPPLTFPAGLMKTLPALLLLAEAGDVEHSQWDGGWNHRKLHGTLVSDGRVYDHVQYYNRGRASTYNTGKNKWGFRMVGGHDFAAHDAYGRVFKKGWDGFSLNACASPWVPSNRGMAGLDEAISFRTYELAGTPSSRAVHTQLRVVTSEAESDAKNQYAGDLWGLYLIVEDVDGRFLATRKMDDGPVFEPSGEPKHTPSGAGKSKAPFEEFMGGMRDHHRSEEWWRANFDLPAFYAFRAINLLTGNVDLREGDNHYLYRDQSGRWTILPWDLDMMFIPKSHQSGRVPEEICLDVPALKLEYQSRVRELLDLLCADASPSGGQFGQLVDEYAALLHPRGFAQGWPELDMCRWNFAPRTSQKGTFYRNPMSGAPDNNWMRTLATPDFNGFARFITEFCTPARPPTAPWKRDDGDPRGYGYGYLVSEAADKAIPERPVIRYAGAPGFPANGLHFECSPFAGAQPFAGQEWRIGAIAAPGVAGYVAGRPRRYEIEEVWTSERLKLPTERFQIPAVAVTPGLAYRARTRVRDLSGRWSHWSAPVPFVAGAAR